MNAVGLVSELAQSLGGVVGGSRPLVEQGLLSHMQQVGLSGRTVRPKLYVACGVSGAVQHVAGMQGSDCIIAINKDKNAPIFEVAHVAVVGDIYEVLPRLIELIGGRGAMATARLHGARGDIQALRAIVDGLRAGRRGSRD